MRNKRKGTAILEFTLVGIPMIFVLISIFELARGMWMYHTTAYAVKEATRLAIVKGQGYVYARDKLGGTGVTVGRIVAEIRQAGVGLDVDDAGSEVKLSGGFDCKPIRVCLGNTAQWPPGGSNRRSQPLSIEVVVPFRSALAMFWPVGGGAARTFGVKYFRAYSEDRIQF